MDEFIRTHDTTSNEMMRVVYGSRVDDDDPIISVHVGEWRHEGNIWRLYRNAEIKHKNGPVIDGLC